MCTCAQVRMRHGAWVEVRGALQESGLALGSPDVAASTFTQLSHPSSPQYQVL